MRVDFTAIVLIALQQIAFVAAKANISCTATADQPSLHFTISPKFIWFPGVITAEDVTNILEHSLTEASRTAYSTGRAARSTIRNFLNSPCTLHLTVAGTQVQPDSSTAFRLLNLTIGDTDLICQLATHKLGRTYTDIPHTMLSSHVRVHVGAKAPTGALSRIQQTRKSEEVAETSGVEYHISCPASAGPTVSGQQAVEVIEGLKGLAQVRDCDWCQKVVGELQGMCKSTGEGGNNLAAFVSEKRWAFGSAACETCK